MSTHESKPNSSQARPQSGKPGNSVQPEAHHTPGNRKPLPYDDDDSGTEGEGTQTSNPPTPDDGMVGKY